MVEMLAYAFPPLLSPQAATPIAYSPGRELHQPRLLPRRLQVYEPRAQELWVYAVAKSSVNKQHGSTCCPQQDQHGAKINFP